MITNKDFYKDDHKILEDRKNNAINKETNPYLIYLSFPSESAPDESKENNIDNGKESSMWRSLKAREDKTSVFKTYLKQVGFLFFMAIGKVGLVWEDCKKVWGSKKNQIEGIDENKNKKNVFFYKLYNDFLLPLFNTVVEGSTARKYGNAYWWIKYACLAAAFLAAIIAGISLFSGFMPVFFTAMGFTALLALPFAIPVIYQASKFLLHSFVYKFFLRTFLYDFVGTALSIIVVNGFWLAVITAIAFWNNICALFKSDTWVGKSPKDGRLFYQEESSTFEEIKNKNAIKLNLKEFFKVSILNGLFRFVVQVSANQVFIMGMLGWHAVLLPLWKLFKDFFAGASKSLFGEEGICSLFKCFKRKTANKTHDNIYQDQKQNPQSEKIEEITKNKKNSKKQHKGGINNDESDTQNFSNNLNFHEEVTKTKTINQQNDNSKNFNSEEYKIF